MPEYNVMYIRTGGLCTSTACTGANRQIIFVTTLLVINKASNIYFYFCNILHCGIHVLFNMTMLQNEHSTFLVTGCEDISPPVHTWFTRDGNSAVIGCESSEHTWHLTCDGSVWQGVVGNCSAGGTITQQLNISQVAIWVWLIWAKIQYIAHLLGTHASFCQVNVSQHTT